MTPAMESAKETKKIQGYLLAHPTESFAEVGRRFDLSRQRISNIAEGIGITQSPQARPRKKCMWCLEALPLRRPTGKLIPESQDFCNRIHKGKYLFNGNKNIQEVGKYGN